MFFLQNLEQEQNYVWDDTELINAYDIAVKLGTRLSRQVSGSRTEQTAEAAADEEDPSVSIYYSEYVATEEDGVEEVVEDEDYGYGYPQDDSLPEVNEAETHGAGDYTYSFRPERQPLPNPVETPNWAEAFPRLLAPPMPSSFAESELFKKGDISSLLMSWYMCGYHSGYFDAKQDFSKKPKEKCKYK